MQDIRHAIQHYLTSYAPFELFGKDHLTAIAVTLAAAFGLSWYCKRYLGDRGRFVVGMTLGLAVAGSYVVWIAFALVGGTFRLDKQLPLHLCWIANLALPVVMAKRPQRLFEIVYYWGIVAGIQATVTPTVEAAFPHLYFFRYMLAHNGMVVALVYVCYVYDMRPSARGIWTAFLVGNLFLALAIPINVTLGSNYFFLCVKPKSPTLLDLLGPWPWYILFGELIALLHFASAYLPFLVADFVRGSRSDSR